MKILMTILLLGLLAPFSSAYALIFNVPFNDELELRRVITKINEFPDDEHLIQFFPSPDPTLPFLITQELPVITSKNVSLLVYGDLVFRPSGGYMGPFLELGEGTNARLDGFEISGFNTGQDGSGIIVGADARVSGRSLKLNSLSSTGNGGAVLCGPRSQCDFQDTIFENNHADGSGGAVFCGSGSTCTCNDCFFDSNHANLNGGVFSCQSGATCNFTRPVGINNSAGVWGCNGDNQGGNVFVRGGAFSQNTPGCDTVGNEIPFGIHVITDGFEAPNNGRDILDCTGDCTIRNSVFDDDIQNGPSVPQKKNTDESHIQSQCNDFGSGAITSLGFNIDSDGSCFLNQSTDLPGTDPMVQIDSNGIPQPLDGSPVIESGPVDFENNELPCLYKDLNGLGRPQDFDLDGVFNCDRGPVEIQGGADIGAPQSAAFYDTDRDGEGVYVEILENGGAVASFYSYNTDGDGLVWIVGVGKVVGNSVVIDEMQKVSGGVFGDGFDPDDIVETPVGGLSLVFPDCEAGANPGRLNFTARDDSGFENLLQKASRLTSIVACDDTPLATNAHRSGAFYAPERSGEGIFVQWLNDGRLVFIFYTFDPDGNPYWIINAPGETTINGDMVTANMLYAQGKTRFGSNFNPDEVTMAPWGTITLSYNDDDNLTFSYSSILAGFGSASHAYTRLTNLAGTRVMAK